MEYCFEECKFHKPVALYGRLNIKTQEILIDKAIVINGILTMSKDKVNIQGLPTSGTGLEVGDLYIRKNGTLRVKR